MNKVESFIRVSLVVAMIAWISFTIYVIIPKLEGNALMMGLSAVIGILSTIFTFLQYRQSKVDEAIAKSQVPQKPGRPPD